jgi:hypothetical protein
MFRNLYRLHSVYRAEEGLFWYRWLRGEGRGDGCAKQHNSRIRTSVVMLIVGGLLGIKDLVVEVRGCRRWFFDGGRIKCGYGGGYCLLGGVREVVVVVEEGRCQRWRSSRDGDGARRESEGTGK